MKGLKAVSKEAKAAMADLGLSIVYSPVNQAYLVLWFDQVFSVCNLIEDALYFVKDITNGKVQ